MVATRPRLKVVEVYAGTGRSVDAFRRWRQAEVALLVDRDQYAADTYRANHPRTPYLVASLPGVRGADLLAHAGGRIDILVGCPPCQGFSDTGSRNRQDGRNAHLSWFRRLVEEVRPRAVALENVPAAAETGRFSRFVSQLTRLGYRGTWGILNSAIYGSPQCRHRLVYIGIRKGAGEAPRLPQPSHGASGKYFSYSAQRLLAIAEDRVALLSEGPAVRRVRENLPFFTDDLGPSRIPTVGEALAGLPAIGSPEANRLSHFRWQHTRTMLRRMEKVPEGGQWEGGADHYSHSYGRLHRRGFGRTITTFFTNPGSGRFWHPTEERALSTREAARLQGFPDDFRFLDHPTGNCRLIGNALDAALAQLTVTVIREALGS